MSKLSLFLLLCLLGACSIRQQGISLLTLNDKQVKGASPGSRMEDSGKSYTKMRSAEGIVDWYEIICSSESAYFIKARECLLELGYSLLGDQGFKTQKGDALMDFHKRNELAEGGLDEATLRLLMLQAEDEKRR